MTDFLGSLSTKDHEEPQRKKLFVHLRVAWWKNFYYQISFSNFRTSTNVSRLTPVGPQ